MAEYGAHITSTTNADLDKPSFFDVVAQETLLESFEPAFKHILKVAAEKNPAKYSWCLFYADEIYLVFHAALQYHYLSNYGASFSENFYSLKRTARTPPKKSNLHSKPLSLEPKLVVKSLIALSVVPYAKQSLHKYFQKLENERAERINTENTIKEKLKTLFLFVWPVVHMAIQFSSLYYYLRYLIGKQNVHSPLLHLVGVHLSRLSEQDLEYIDERSNKLTFSNVKSARHFCRWTFESFGWCLQNFLEVGAFFLQFLDWFYSSNATRKTLFSSSPIPSPPEVDTSMDPFKCPLCLKERRQETALSVSGYVFCYSCILLHVRQFGTCPVTNYPASTKQLIKIYKE